MYGTVSLVEVYTKLCVSLSSPPLPTFQVEKFGKPTRKRLVEAVKHPAGGNNCALAQTIACDHPSEPGDCYIQPGWCELQASHSLHARTSTLSTTFNLNKADVHTR